jgi:hypothetical protein
VSLIKSTLTSQHLQIDKDSFLLKCLRANHRPKLYNLSQAIVMHENNNHTHTQNLYLKNVTNLSNLFHNFVVKYAHVYFDSIQPQWRFNWLEQFPHKRKLVNWFYTASNLISGDYSFAKNLAIWSEITGLSDTTIITVILNVMVSVSCRGKRLMSQ